MTNPGSQVSEAIGRQTVRFRVARLRRITARPFGLITADTAVMLGDESSSTGLVAEIRAAVTRAPVRLDSISLLYGDGMDLSAPFVEVSTRWDKRLADDFRRELGRAAHRDEAIARGDWLSMAGIDAKPAAGPFETGHLDVVIGGTPSRVGTVSFRDYLAFSFPVQDAKVTVVSRHPLPDLPHFDPVADLEPFCAGWASFMEDLYGQPRPSLT
jgi:hypothetical protein